VLRRVLAALFVLAPLACVHGSIEETAGVPGASPDEPGKTEEAFAPAPAVVPRLTATQHHNSLVDLLRGPVPATQLEADTAPYLFTTIGAATTTISERGVSQWEDAALNAARAVFADPARRDALVGCEPDDTCARAFIAGFTRRAFRRPVDVAEVEQWVAIGKKVAPGNAWLALEMSVAGILQAPSFLYRLELGKPDPARPGWNRLDSYELASRLSFLLWSSVPDEELLNAATTGELEKDDVLAKEVDRMLDDPRARPALMAFHKQWLDLADIDSLQRDPMKYPDARPGFGASMRGEIERLLDDVTLEDRDFRDLFDRRTTWVDANLAAIYRLDVKPAPGTFERVVLPSDGPRAGLLTTAGFLAVNAHPEVTSPTRRGKFVRERLLCEYVPPPPDNDATDLDADKETTAPKTQREKLERHRTDPKCAGCHKFVDPIGLGFEDFDSMGVHRTMELDKPVDARGDLDGIQFTGGKALGKILRDDARTTSCVARQLFRFATGRLEIASEEPAMIAIAKSFSASGHKFRALIHALVKSDAFRYTLEVKP
jgi:hypothetical protein